MNLSESKMKEIDFSPEQELLKRKKFVHSVIQN